MGKKKKRKKRRDRSSSSSSSGDRSSSGSSDCQMGEPSKPSSGGSKQPENTGDPEIEKAKSEALEELMRLRTIEPNEARMTEWRALLRKWHPDKNPDRVEVATAVFQFLQKGKAILNGAAGAG